MRFVFWWNIPCKGMIGVLREFCKLEPESVVYTGETSAHRLAMGWSKQSSLFPQHTIIKNLGQSQWRQDLERLFAGHRNDFHIVNGLVNSIFSPLLDDVIRSRTPYATMAEAPCNMYDGVRWLAKTALSPILQPWRHRRFAATARAFISLSGEKKHDLRNIEKLGFSRERIFPFGYYTDADPNFVYSPAEDGKIHLLCPGLLEKYKGVDILILAIRELHRRGVSGFHCHITGNGSRRNELEALVDKSAIREVVTLHGALDEKTYQKLLRNIDILVAPGRREPWGIRINEAIQRGQAVVTSDGLGASTLIERSGGGVVFKSASVDDLCAKLETLLIDRRALAATREKNRMFAPQISCETAAKRLHEILRKNVSLSYRACG